MAGGSDLPGGHDGEELRGSTCDLQSPCWVSVIAKSALWASLVLFEFIEDFMAPLPSLALNLVFQSL